MYPIPLASVPPSYHLIRIQPSHPGSSCIPTPSFRIHTNRRRASTPRTFTDSTAQARLCLVLCTMYIRRFHGTVMYSRPVVVEERNCILVLPMGQSWWGKTAALCDFVCLVPRSNSSLNVIHCDRVLRGMDECSTSLLRYLSREDGASKPDLNLIRSIKRPFLAVIITCELELISTAPSFFTRSKLPYRCRW